jgi:predicted alpha/beta-fold hydrolase
MSIIVRTLLIFKLLLVVQYAHSQNDIQQLTFEASDGNRITGFIYQKRQTPEEAPLAFLMHGLTGSSLHWLAPGNLSYGDQITAYLVNSGYRVIALDARAHGVRK